MIKINLVPREILDKEVQRLRAVQAGAAGAVVLVLLLLLSAAHWWRSVSLNNLLTERELEYKKLEEIVKKVEELEHTAQALRSRLQVVTDLLKGRPLYPYFMMDMSSSLPPSVWLKQLETATGTGNQLSVKTQAVSLSSEGISEWMRSLVKSGRFSEPGLSAITVSDTGTGKQHNFSLSTSYKHPDL